MTALQIYYDRAGNPVDNLTDWLRGRTAEQVPVARTVLDGGVIVSSVWLGLNLAIDGPPMVYQTTVTGGPHDLATWRYPTEAATLDGHARVVAGLKAEGAP